MLTDGSGITARLTAAVAVVFGALAWVGLTLWVNGGREFAKPSWLGIVVLALMAAVMLVAGLDIRRYLRGRATRAPSPLRGRRTLVAAQASALGGAVITGWYSAQAVILLPNADVPSVRSDLWLTLGLIGGAVLLAVAGLLAQGMCRIPRQRGKDDDDDE